MNEIDERLGWRLSRRCSSARAHGVHGDGVLQAGDFRETKGFNKWLVSELEERDSGVRSTRCGCIDAGMHELVRAVVDCGHRA